MWYADKIVPRFVHDMLQPGHDFDRCSRELSDIRIAVWAVRDVDLRRVSFGDWTLTFCFDKGPFLGPWSLWEMRLSAAV